MKCYWTVNFILTDAKRRSIWIVYSSVTLHVHRNKSQQLFHYIKRYFSWKVCHLRQISVDVPSEPCDITTSHHRLCDISWGDATIHATLGRYVINHATSSIVDLTWLASRPMKWLLFINYIVTIITCFIRYSNNLLSYPVRYCSCFRTYTGHSGLLPHRYRPACVAASGWRNVWWNHKILTR